MARSLPNPSQFVLVAGCHAAIVLLGGPGLNLLTGQHWWLAAAPAEGLAGSWGLSGQTGRG